MKNHKHLFHAFAGAHNLGKFAGPAYRPSNVTICDYYANGAFGASNATTQYALLTRLVNTAVIGNYTNGSTTAVPGILASNATYNGTHVDLVQYFDGSLDSSNRGGKHGVAINFLDGGGAAPLMQDKPADGTTSNQYQLLTHLYTFFGTLLGCANQSSAAFPAYSGETSMFSVHKFMALDAYEVQYFIQQVGLAAESLGVQEPDVEEVGNALLKYFGYKCSPPTDVLPKGKKELQSICVASDCPEAPGASKKTCKAYGKVVQPKNATMPAKNGTTAGTAGKPSKGLATQVGVSLCTMLVLLASFVAFFG